MDDRHGAGAAREMVAPATNAEPTDGQGGVDLSVVIVSWNTKPELLDCLESVARSRRGVSTEIIVVDNASADGSAEAVETQFPWVKVIRSGGNLGFAGGCNVGLRQTIGRYQLLLNPDTLVLGDVLVDTVRYLDDHPDVGAFGCRVLAPDGDVDPTCFRDPSVLNTVLHITGASKLSRPRWFGREQMSDWDRGSERDVDVVTGCYLAVRRETVDQVGLLDDGYFFCGEESDWCRRIREHGWAVRFAPVGDIVHRSGVAGRKLSHRRDLFLTAGLIRFAAKHDGTVAGWTTWWLLWLFNATRVVGWGAAALARRGRRATDARARRDHFAAVLRDYGEVSVLAGLRQP